MRCVYKYRLALTPWQVVDMPQGAKLLTAQMQGEFPCIWVEVDDTAKKSKREIWIFGTGHEIPPKGVFVFVSTFQMNGSGLVFHVYEKTG